MDPLLHLTLRASLALLLGSAALHKWRGLDAFRSAFAGYELLPRGSASRLALFVPLAETAIALLLAAGLFLPLAASAAAALFLVYGAAIFVNIRRGRSDIDCGCMGPASRVALSPVLVARNLTLAAAALLLVAAPATRGLGLIDLLAAAFATTTLAACWQASERMLALAPRVAVLRSRMRSGARGRGEA